MILNRCALNTGAPNLIKQIQLAVKPPSNPSKIIDASVILWRFLSIDRPSLLKEIEIWTLNDITDQEDLEPVGHFIQILLTTHPSWQPMELLSKETIC